MKQIGKSRTLAVTKDWFDEKRGSEKGVWEWGGRDTKLAGTGKWQ